MRSEEHRKIEAVLFAVGRDIAIEEIAQLCSLEGKQVLSVLEDLQKEYNQNTECSLVLQEKGKFWKFSVKNAYLPLVTSLVQRTDLDKSVMETLAVIAWKYPIMQADLIKIRHNKAYDHLKMLQEREFIAKEKFGRTYRIKLTPKFFDYFDLPTQDAKAAFRKVFSPDVQEQVERAEQEIELKEKEIEEKEKRETKTHDNPVERSEEQLAKEAADAIDETDESEGN
ncbi:SMC-Scp complex subunit ScpB [Candidatus Woesearchaeota archaeon]|nr:SMC-Scp complex subunit ScpB [Candidatus Woesearchaeota archaeon]